LHSSFIALLTESMHTQVKLWNTASGFCFVTFSDHSTSVTGLCFNTSGKVVVSCSLDGTVRAFDMHRFVFALVGRKGDWKLFTSIKFSVSVVCEVRLKGFRLYDLKGIPGLQTFKTNAILRLIYFH